MFLQKKNKVSNTPRKDAPSKDLSNRPTIWCKSFSFNFYIHFLKRPAAQKNILQHYWASVDLPTDAGNFYALSVTNKVGGGGLEILADNLQPNVWHIVDHHCCCSPLHHCCRPPLHRRLIYCMKTHCALTLHLKPGFSWRRTWISLPWRVVQRPICLQFRPQSPPQTLAILQTAVKCPASGSPRIATLVFSLLYIDGYYPSIVKKRMVFLDVILATVSVYIYHDIHFTANSSNLA